MGEGWRIFIILNFSIAIGGITLFFIKNCLGRVGHNTSTLMLVLCLLAPIIGYINPIQGIQKIKFSAQEFVDLKLGPPVLPEEDIKNLPPAIIEWSESRPFTEKYDLLKIVTMVYVTVVVCFLLWFLFQYIYLQYLLSRSIRHKKIKNVRVLISTNFHAPFSTVYGLFPVLVVPQYLISKKELKWVLRHEFQHIKQGDVYLNYFLTLLKFICFFNPVIWWWSKDLKESMEFACDDKLTSKYPSEKKDYAYAILEIAEKSLEYKIINNLCAGMASLGRDKQQILTRRIKMIAKKKSLKPWHVVISTGFLTIVSTLAFSAGVPQKKISHDQLSGENSKNIESAILYGLRKSKATKGFAIITEPKSGKVLYAKGFMSDGTELNDDFLSSPYAPFSIAKPLLTALAIDSNVTTAATSHNCHDGRIKIGDQTYRDYKPFKTLTTEQALVLSSNVCSIKVAQKLTNKQLISGLESLGFGKGSVVDSYPNAAEGIVRRYKGASEIYQAPNFVTGYHSIYVTPLEVSQAYSALLNGGYLNEPTVNGNGVGKRVLSSNSAEVLKSMLAKVVSEGTGRNAKDSILKIGGKTASSPGGPYDSNKRVSFIGAAPINSPKLLVYVIIDGATVKHRTGGRLAAPIVKKILKTLL